MKLDAFTDWLHGEIHKTLARDPHSKSYEGEMGVHISDVFTEPREVVLLLKMYVIAPSGRQHEWHGTTIEECCDKAHAEISEWIKLDQAELVGNCGDCRMRGYDGDCALMRESTGDHAEDETLHPLCPLLDGNFVIGLRKDALP